MRTKRQFYGWFDPRDGTFRVSLYPPDAPVRPSGRFETLAEVTALIERKRGNILWWPPLPTTLLRAS